MAEDTRRAGAAFAFTDAQGRPGPTGNAEAVIGGDALGVGPVTAQFLDADALRAADYRIEVDCWPGGRLTLTQLGRRFDTFVRELRRARNQARVKGLDWQFQCPRHHSRYQPDGVFVSGRATRGMDRFAVRRDAGNIVVDVSRLYRQDRDGALWDAAVLNL